MTEIMTLPQPENTTPRAVVRRMSDVQPKPIDWLWPGRFALGKLSLISGDPGTSKSTLTLAMATTVSVGGTWPVERAAAPLGDVLILSAEDDPQDTLRPRLDAAGAALERIKTIDAVRDPSAKGERFLSLDRDIPVIEDVLAEMDCPRLVIIDPINAYIGQIDSHVDSQVRSILAPLAQLAARRHVAIVLVAHLNKGQGKAIYRTGGSIGYVGAVRAAYVVAADEADNTRRLMVPSKNNLGDDRTGFAFRVESAENGHPYITWESELVTRSADELLTSSPGRPEKVTDAAIWLHGQLTQGGPIAVTDLRIGAETYNYSWRTMERVKKDMGVQSFRTDGAWYWRLPEPGASDINSFGGLTDNHKSL